MAPEGLAMAWKARGAPTGIVAGKTGAARSVMREVGGHLGLVVDDLEAAAAHLHRQFPDFLGHGTLLERAERLSLYGHVQFGSISFMIQLSQIKAPYRGLTTEPARQAADELYDYASRDYGIRLG